jgi:hypothetical protein
MKNEQFITLMLSIVFFMFLHVHYSLYSCHPWQACQSNYELMTCDTSEF